MVDVEVHTVDTRRGVVLEPQADVLRDTEAEAPSIAEVLLPELVPHFSVSQTSPLKTHTALVFDER